MEHIPTIAGLVMGFGTILAGIWQFRQASKQSAMTPYLEKRLELYEQATRVAGLLCSSRDPEKIERATEEFWMLYFGPMALVEDSEVEKAMVEFGYALTAHVDELRRSKDQISKSALSLAVACRDSVSESWKLDLTPLANRMAKD